MNRDQTVALIRDYPTAIEAKDVARVGALLDDSVRQHEYPNALVKAGAARDRATVLDGLAKGARVLRAERYDIEDALVDGDRVACRVHWRATLAVPVLGKAAGEELEARFGVFFLLRNGKIVEQHNYDCFYLEPPSDERAP